MKVLFLVLFVGIFSGVSCFGSVDILMKFTGSNTDVDGDSQDDAYPADEGWFNVTSMEFGIENTVNVGSTTSGGGAGRAEFKVLNLTKLSNAVSAMLFTRTATGAHFEGAEVVIVKSGSGGAGSSLVMKVELRLVLVQSVGMAVADGDDHAEESVELRYGAHQITFYKQNLQGVTSVAGTSVWSQVKNNASLEVD